MSTNHDTPASERRRDPAEEARTLISSLTVGHLATVSDEGEPWCALVSYGPTADGDPVMLLSSEAEEGRNLATQPRASLAIHDPLGPGDPLDRSRITLAGRVVRPEGDDAERALDAHVAAIPAAMLYAAWDEFSVWVLEVEQVRCVGSLFQTDMIGREVYRAAEPDPTAPVAAKMAEHLNKSPDGLLAIARELAGARGAVSAVCTGIDRYGIDLACTGAGQSAAARVLFDEPLSTASELRPAAAGLIERAQTASE
jgi:heme iron utilization protein